MGRLTHKEMATVQGQARRERSLVREGVSGSGHAWRERQLKLGSCLWSAGEVCGLNCGDQGLSRALCLKPHTSPRLCRAAPTSLQRDQEKNMGQTCSDQHPPKQLTCAPQEPMRGKERLRTGPDWGRLWRHGGILGCLLGHRMGSRKMVTFKYSLGLMDDFASMSIV